MSKATYLVRITLHDADVEPTEDPSGIPSDEPREEQTEVQKALTLDELESIVKAAVEVRTLLPVGVSAERVDA